MLVILASFTVSAQRWPCFSEFLCLADATAMAFAHPTPTSRPLGKQSHRYAIATADMAIPATPYAISGFE